MYIYLYLKQKIHDLEYAINTQEKSYGNLQEENKQLLQEVYLKIYIYRIMIYKILHKIQLKKENNQKMII